MDELHRPPFSGPCLRLNEVSRFLDYERVRDLDKVNKTNEDFDFSTLMSAREIVD